MKKSLTKISASNLPHFFLEQQQVQRTSFAALRLVSCNWRVLLHFTHSTRQVTWLFEVFRSDRKPAGTVWPFQFDIRNSQIPCLLVESVSRGLCNRVPTHLPLTSILVHIPQQHFEVPAVWATGSQFQTEATGTSGPSHLFPKWPPCWVSDRVICLIRWYRVPFSTSDLQSSSWDQEHETTRVLTLLCGSVRLYCRFCSHSSLNIFVLVDTFVSKRPCHLLFWSGAKEKQG